MLSGHLSNGDALFTFCLQHLSKLYKLSTSTPYPAAALCTLELAVATFSQTVGTIIDKLFCELDYAIKL